MSPRSIIQGASLKRRPLEPAAAEPLRALRNSNRNPRPTARNVRHKWKLYPAFAWSHGQRSQSCSQTQEGTSRIETCLDRASWPALHPPPPAVQPRWSGRGLSAPNPAGPLYPRQPAYSGAHRLMANTGCHQGEVTAPRKLVCALDRWPAVPPAVAALKALSSNRKLACSQPCQPEASCQAGAATQPATRGTVDERPSRASKASPPADTAPAGSGRCWTVAMPRTEKRQSLASTDRPAIVATAI